MAHVDALTQDEWLGVVRAASGAAAGAGVALLGVEPAAAKGEFGGFVGDSLPVRVRAAVGGEERWFAVFMKAVPQDSADRAAFATESGSFVKETGLYATVFPRLREAAVEALRAAGGDDTSAREPEWAPRAFFIRPDMLVLEDLREPGFEERNVRLPLDVPHCACVLRALAVMHADAFALADRLHPRSLAQEFPELLAENMFVDTPKSGIGMWFAACIRNIPKALGYVPELKAHPKFKAAVAKLPEVFRRMFVLAQPSTRFRNVLCHGDLWSNNFLFRYDADRNPVEARFVDFQLARYAPPATDLVSFLHLATTRAFREARAADMLALYHDELSRALERRGLAVDRVLPRAELTASYEEYRLFGLVIAPCYHHMSLIPPPIFKRNFQPDKYEEFMFGDREPLIAECFREDDYYREKISAELIELAEGALFGCNVKKNGENGQSRIV